MKTRGISITTPGWLALCLLAGGAMRAAAQFSTPPQAGASATPPIRDISPPVDVFPYPMWMVWTAVAIALVLLGFLAGLGMRLLRNRPAPAPPTPREIALRRLEAARADVDQKQPYEFSIQVSDILRHFVSGHYHVHATEQTSPEFLAEAARTPHFTAADKRLLAAFLERCDLIKFARVDAAVEDSRTLLDQAVAFVKGGAA